MRRSSVWYGQKADTLAAAFTARVSKRTPLDRTGRLGASPRAFPELLGAERLVRSGGLSVVLSISGDDHSIGRPDVCADVIERVRNRSRLVHSDTSLDGLNHGRDDGGGYDRVHVGHVCESATQYLDLNLDLIVSAAVFALSLWLVRSQAMAGDVACIKATIPHHSIVILASERARIHDPSVRRLDDGIIRAQVKEIAEMTAPIADLDRIPSPQGAPTLQSYRQRGAPPPSPEQ